MHPDQEKRRQQADRHREKAALRQAAISAAGREVPPLPPPQDPDRRDNCKHNLALFLLTYFPKAFRLKWSKDHTTVIAKIQQAVLSGGLFALAMPRGSGKTTICERAILWAILYGHHHFAMLVGANKDKATESMDKIKLELETNEFLLDDFPEACIPARRIAGVANRAKGQLYKGVPTKIQWAKQVIVLATIPDATCSGAIIKTGAVRSAVRGANHGRTDGTVDRPSLVLLDDPQTRNTAKSENQTNLLEKIVSGDVLGLAGPDQKIAALMTCTVIEQNDLADRMLNRSTHPDWQGERMKLVYEFPTRMELWEEYRELVADLLGRDASPEQVTDAANAFYKKNRKAMDEGAVVAWPERILPGDLSALQSAINIYFRDPEAFASEYQNEPVVADDAADELQTVDQIARKINNLERGRVPLRAQHLTAMIDVHGRLLYWTVCWWDDDFTGGVLDYGVWPRQLRTNFALKTCEPTIPKATKLRATLPAVKKALKILQDELAARTWKRDDGIELKIERCLSDANWGYSTDTVYEVCRESDHKNIMRPSHGKGITEKQKPMSQWQTKDGEKAGHHWFRRTGKRGVRYLLIDTNYWKTAVHDALALDAAENHGLSFFKAPPSVHRLMAEHLTAEYRERKQADDGRSVDIWKLQPSKPDNHWFDTIVGCMVGASELGCKMSKPSGINKPKEDPRSKPAPTSRVTPLQI